MASPTAGTYRIVSAKGSSTSPFSLDVSGGSKKNGANVQIYTPNFTAAQFFRLSYRSDGSAQILSMWSGKSLDILNGNVASGTNIQQYTDNDTRAQKWVVESDGDSATYDGTSYPTYTIKSSANTSLAFDIAGGSMANGTNVRVYTANQTEAQQWLFVTMPKFASGGTYELRSMLKTSMTVDISGGSSVKGANVQLYHVNHSNAQTYYLTEESTDEWSIQNVGSGMYLDVKGGTAREGQNVQQYTDNDTRAQRWVITPYGTTTIDGIECQVVTIGSMVSGGSTYMMDVENALTTDKANIQIATASGATAQRFALFPATPRNTSLPVPAQVGWSESVGDEDWTRRRPESTTYYPTWVTTESWASDSANHHQWRYRSRLMGGSTWGDFSDWTDWETAAVTVSGKQCWVTEGLPASVASGYKALQYEVQVRSAEPQDDGSVTVGLETAATLQSDLVPTIALSTAGFGPEGLRVSYTSDYDEGTNNIAIDSITVSSTEMLSEPVYFSGLDSSGSVLVEMGKLNEWIDDGASATVTYRVGTDQWPTFDDEQTATISVSYNTGSGLSATPTIAVGEGKTIAVTVPSASIVSAWMRQDGGSLKSMTLRNGTAVLSPPFGSTLDYEFYVAVQSGDGDSWGVANITASDCAEAISTAGGFRACHAWNWNGGYFLLEMREGESLETEYSVSRSMGTFSLNNREWESVHYSPTSSGSFSAEGAIPNAFSVTDARSRLFELCRQGYVTYRSPHGLVADVAVTGFNLRQNNVYAEVSVAMTRVTN